MTTKQFQDYLLSLAQSARCMSDLLQNIVKREVDSKIRSEYDVDIESIILDLSNVMSDCTFLAHIMRMNECIE